MATGAVGSKVYFQMWFISIVGGGETKPLSDAYSARGVMNWKSVEWK